MGPLRKRAAILRPSNGACRARGFRVILALILALVVNIDHAEAREILIGSHDELQAALQGAKGGETILLAPGDYRLNISVPYGSPWGAFPGDVTLRSADPGNPAVMSNVQLREVTNLHFDGLVFQHTANQSLDASAMNRETPFLVRSSRNVSFTNSTFRGDFMDQPDHRNDGLAVGYGLNVRGGQYINVSDNHFKDWTRALIVNSARNVQVAGNLVEHIRSDGFNFASVQNVLIEGNHLRDFVSRPESGDHRDMIQFWTSGTSRPTTDVVIRGNILDSGSGIETQSIFMRNEMVDSRGAGLDMYYRNILIEDNFIHNAHLHGITVGETLGLEIRNNTLLQNADSIRSGVPAEPRINIKSRSQDVVVVGNVAHAFPTAPDAERNWTLANNLTVQRSDPLRPNHYDEFFVNARAGSVARLEDFAVLPGSLADLQEIGATVTRFTAKPEQLTARLLGSSVTGVYGGFRFDGGLSADPSGFLDDERARFVWDFGDGTVVEGLAAEHVFSTWGDNIVTLTVTHPDGSTDTVRTRVNVPNPQRLMLEATADGIFDTSRMEPTRRLSGATVVEDGDIRGIQLSRDAGMSISRGSVGGIFGLERFALDLMLKADAGDASRGEIFRIHQNMRLRAGSDGRLTFDLHTASGEQLTLRTRPTALMNGDWHAVRIVYDGLEGRLLAMLNGEEIGEFLADGPTGPTGPRRSWNLNFGQIYSSGGFSGLLGSFEIDALPEEFGGTPETGGWKVDPTTPPAGSDPSDGGAGPGEADPGGVPGGDDVDAGEENAGNDTPDGEQEADPAEPDPAAQACAELGLATPACTSPDDLADIVLPLIGMIDPAEDAPGELAGLIPGLSPEALLWGIDPETGELWWSYHPDAGDPDLLAFLIGGEEFDLLIDADAAPAQGDEPGHFWTSAGQELLDGPITRLGFFTAPKTPIAPIPLPPAGWLLLGTLGGLALLGMRRARAAPPKA